MGNDKDSLPWITVFPDYPRAFAWRRPPCAESELTSSVGLCCGCIETVGHQAMLDNNKLPKWLAQRFSSWMDKWEELDMNGEISDLEECATKEERAIDDEGVELTKALKSLYGDKYRFRYSFAWRYNDGDWIVV